MDIPDCTSWWPVENYVRDVVQNVGLFSSISNVVDHMIDTEQALEEERFANMFLLTIKREEIWVAKSVGWL